MCTSTLRVAFCANEPLSPGVAPLHLPNSYNWQTVSVKQSTMGEMPRAEECHEALDYPGKPILIGEKLEVLIHRRRLAYYCSVECDALSGAASARDALSLTE